jgi:membrane protease YdiL (CAAX protease family)
VLCLLYRRTGSLYPGIATHSVNNSLAFGVLENWGVSRIVLLLAAALVAIRLLTVVFRRVGLISTVPTYAVAPTAYDQL